MVDLQFVLVLGIQKSDLVIYTYVSFFFFFLRLFYHTGYYKLLGIVPCAIQQSRAGNLFYIQ